ncbi:hypothetical protein E5288_WYG022264 [Bos mutus]|uniref:Uncharacterized protein n=1 Tax=Bos mutus TaxID=72004 RepID=A0A6B0S154_9CETA|nr:hypothetical protein [Bos mutus]
MEVDPRGNRAPGKLRVPISVAAPVAPPDAAKHGPALPAGASGVTLTPNCDPGCIRGRAPHLESGGTVVPGLWTFVKAQILPCSGHSVSLSSLECGLDVAARQ